MIDGKYQSLRKFTTTGEPVTHWGSSGEEGYLNTPKGIALSAEGAVYVVDTRNHRIGKFDGNGNLQTTWGSYGMAESQFRYPYGVALDSKGRIYVTDSGNERVQRFGADAVFDAQWGETGTAGQAEGLFDWPCGIAVNSRDHVFVVDQNNHRIQVLTGEAEGFEEWKTAPDARQLFERPFGIAVDRADHIYVTDIGRDAVYQFSSQGILLNTWEESDGSKAHDFDQPQGITAGIVDGEEYIYVADSGNHRILQFLPDGTPVSEIGRFGHSPGEFSYPGDAAVAPEGALYIADTDNHRIQLFESTDRPVQKAILVAGGGPYPGNKLWDATRAAANQAYWTLKYQGFHFEEILYLSEDYKGEQANDEDPGDIDAAPSSDGLSQAITEWAHDADTLLLYLVDHGGEKTFRLNDHQMLRAEELADRLDRFQSADPSKRAILIIDACASGSFTDPLLLTDAERIVITGTAPQENAHFISQGAISFSGLFWAQVFSGFSVSEAFGGAKDLLFEFGLQTPQMESAGGIDPETVWIGNDRDNFNSGPRIGEPEIIETDGTFRISVPEVTDKDGVSRVWAVIRPRNEMPQSPDIPILDLPEIELMPAEEGGYAGEIRSISLGRDKTISIHAADRIGNISFSRPVLSDADTASARPKALIGAGRFPGERTAPDLDSIIHVLKSQGFGDEDILLLSPEDRWNQADLQSKLEALVPQAASGVSDLILYLAGAGGKAGFFTGSGDFMDIRTLDHWLDALQKRLLGNLILIFDTDDAGSLLPHLMPPAGDRRIVIAGTGQDQEAFFLPEQNLSFSMFFWQEIFNGRDVRSAFDMAGNAIRYLSGAPEAALPVMDADGNGIGNERADSAAAAGQLIGDGIGRGTNGPVIPFQSETHVLPDGSSTFALSVEAITAAGQIAQVRAAIAPPAPQTPATSSASEIRWERLEPDGSGGYGALLSGFDTFGYHQVSIYAEDDAGRDALSENFTIYQPKGADVYEPDNDLGRAAQIIINAETPQLRSLHEAADEDRITFHGLAGKSYTFRIHCLGQPGSIHLEVFRLDGRPDDPEDHTFSPGQDSYETWIWKCTRDGIYGIRIKSEDAFDRTIGYGIEIYHPIGPLNGYLKGRVIDAKSAAPVKGATILLSDQSGTAVASCLSRSGGNYLMIHAPGTYTLTVSGQGYLLSSMPAVIGEGGISVMDLSLEKVSGVDSPNPAPVPAPPVPAPPIPPPSIPSDDCPDDPEKTAPSLCGCGISDADRDGDGTPDCMDGCAEDPEKRTPGICGCGLSDADSDNDGTPDCMDGCPEDPEDRCQKPDPHKEPLPPELIRPANGSADISLTPKLEIEICQGDAEDYCRGTRWQISQNQDFSETLWETNLEGTVNSIMIPPFLLLSDTRYYWRVCFADADDETDNIICSSVHVFTTLAEEKKVPDPQKPEGQSISPLENLSAGDTGGVGCFIHGANSGHWASIFENL